MLSLLGLISAFIISAFIHSIFLIRIGEGVNRSTLAHLVQFIFRLMLLEAARVIEMAKINITSSSTSNHLGNNSFSGPVEQYFIVC